MSGIEAKKYIANPDVVVREADEDGALLFNPDNNDVKIINATGMCIWKALSNSAFLSEIIAAVKIEFDKVPEEEIEADVKEFVESLVEAEFIGRV